jgi:hypothetical protein
MMGEQYSAWTSGALLLHSRPFGGCFRIGLLYIDPFACLTMIFSPTFITFLITVVIFTTVDSQVVPLVFSVVSRSTSVPLPRPSPCFRHTICRWVIPVAFILPFSLFFSWSFWPFSPTDGPASLPRPYSLRWTLLDRVASLRFFPQLPHSPRDRGHLHHGRFTDGALCFFLWSSGLDKYCSSSFQFLL